jgi:hypothetical protein
MSAWTPAIPSEPSEQPLTARPRPRVGVRPARALDSLGRLFDALAQAFPVTFVDAQTADRIGLDGMLVLDAADDPGCPSTPELGRAPDRTRVSGGAHVFDSFDALDVPAGLPALVAATAHGHRVDPALITFSADQRVHRALRGRRLSDDVTAHSATFARERPERVLATAAGRPVWWESSERAQVSAFALHELQAGETLRDHLRPGRFMGLVPLLHFLHALTDGDHAGESGYAAENQAAGNGGEVGHDPRTGWGERPLRAAFVIDDPNLHWTSYGYLRYPELVDHARRHGYHIALATVPLDGWCVNRRAARLIGGHSAQVSLLVHGNDHVARELGRLASDGPAQSAVAQALRRVAAFERRARVRVSRVMAPPHGACSEAVLRAMFRLGFEAACISSPYPWRGRLPPPTPLAGWHPAELVAGGLPVLPRYHLDHPRDELVFRALLGQPLVLYGHHWDMAGGLDVLGQAVADVNGLGDVRWSPLEQIARANFTCARAGDVLAIQLFSRAASVDVPAGVAAVRVETPDVHGGPLWRGVTCDGLRAPMMRANGGWTSPEIPVSVGAGRTVRATLEPARPLDFAALAGPAIKPWPLTRRLLVEGRDRLRPLLGSS